MLFPFKSGTAFSRELVARLSRGKLYPKEPKILKMLIG